MKKIKKAPLAVAVITIILAVAAITASFTPVPVHAASDEAYAFHFVTYDAVYDIKSNREMSVTETLTIAYTGYANTGFIKTIPVNGGEMVKHVSVTEIDKSNKEISVPYDVYGDQDDDFNNYFCVDIGSTSNKSGEVHTYKINYIYGLTSAQEGANALKLNVIGVDRASYCYIESANVTLLLPDGYESGKCFAGKLGTSNEIEFTATDEIGRKALKLENLPLAYNEGVTFSLQFKEGSLSLYTSFAPYWAAIAGAALLLLLVAVKFIFFRKSDLTPIVNFEAPEGIDPLLAGKLIDNAVNSEDISAMIFYWADKGYLKINLDNKDDPTLIRIVRDLPESSPAYEKLMFGDLFKSGDTVQPSGLKNKFYTTVGKVTAVVNSKAKNLYDGKSMRLALLFAFLGGLIPGIAPLILGLTQVSSTYICLLPLITVIPVLVIYGLCETFKFNTHKFNKVTKAAYCIGLAALCAAVIAAYAFLAPSWLFGIFQKILISALGCMVSCLSVTLISRTDEYTEKLNGIVGFKQFISLVEKDKLEELLESDPQYYYHVLPYAQVLGVSDIWEDKFKDITVAPPAWATSSVASDIIQFHILSSILRNSMHNMSSAMVSRPSSSGSSGFGGFGGGGHVGGGHGGGGFRGR